MTPGRLRGAVVGLGHMGRHHLRKLSGRADVDVVGVDPSLGHPADVLADPAALDFAVIATPTASHLAVAEPLLQAGVACLVEKPLGATLTQARRLAQHPRLCVGHVERFNPALAPITAALAESPPAFVEATRLSPWRAPRAGARGTDVDVVADLMLHDLDLVLHWLGDDHGRVQVRDLRAVGVGVLSGSADIVDARLELAGPRGDVVVVLRASRVSPAPVRTVRVFAPGRYWSADLLSGAAHRVDWGGAVAAGDLVPQALPVPGGADALDRELDAFLAGVRGDADFAVSGATAVAAMELVAQVQAALQR